MLKPWDDKRDGEWWTCPRCLERRQASYSNRVPHLCAVCALAMRIPTSETLVKPSGLKWVYGYSCGEWSLVSSLGVLGYIRPNLDKSWSAWFGGKEFIGTLHDCAHAIKKAVKVSE